MISLGLLNLLGPAARTVFATVLIKGSVILLLTGFAMHLLARASSARRFAVGSVGLAALLLIPLFSHLLPTWQISRHHLLGQPSAPVIETVARSAEPTAPPESSGNGAVPVPHRLPSSTAWTSIGDLFILGFLLVWAGGLVLMLCRLARHAVNARRMIRGAVEYDDGELALLLDRLTSPVARRGRIRLLVGTDLGIPFTCGIFRPVIVFPGEARRWDRGQKQSVLLHEYAHLVRYDHLIHLMIELARAVYWLNPLVWFIARRSAIERERACDDFALRFGTRSETYAGHLLSIARAQLGVTVPVGSATMAGRSGLRERIAGVMDREADRTPVRRERLLPAAAAALVLLIPFSTLDTSRSSFSLPSTRQLIVDLGGHPDPLMRRQAAWWLGEHEDRAGVESLIESLHGDVPAVRVVAAWALGEIKDERAIGPLLTATHDDDPRVREMAILALGEIEDPVVLGPLERSFQDEQERSLPADRDLADAFIWALGEIGTPDAEAIRSRILRRTGQRPRENAEVWNGRLDDNMAVEACRLPAGLSRLLRDLGHTDTRIRHLAAFKLGIYGLLGVPRVIGAVNPLLDILDDPDPGVRAMAVWALDEINPSRWGRGSP